MPFWVCSTRTLRGPEAAKSFSCFPGICAHPSRLAPGGFVGLRDWCRRVNVPINAPEPRRSPGTIRDQLMQARHSPGNPGSPRRKTRPLKVQSDFGEGGSRRKTWPGFPASTGASQERQKFGFNAPPDLRREGIIRDKSQPRCSCYGISSLSIPHAPKSSGILRLEPRDEQPALPGGICPPCPISLAPGEAIPGSGAVTSHRDNSGWLREGMEGMEIGLAGAGTGEEWDGVSWKTRGGEGFDPKWLRDARLRFRLGLKGKWRWEESSAGGFGA